jgi:hypothetical protein
MANVQMAKSNVMILMGDDFTCANQFACFKQIDALIDYCNEHQKSNMTFIYSTPSKYIQALKKENVTWPVIKNHDFLPYAKEHSTYWSGFFTSRPGLKK